ncbi:hypothetical protein [Tenacibaculum maritimum]|uniref:hypothetical protein n=1 Tax=Tenacibaculum maritimum TaxID=107401 RepID=UPI0012E6A4A5|nr:hypothetical protein [Tenacibaculum maritimum]MCD9585068.1 hypothetical protein [Tenacibaculum maritimum]MCD9620848.1 hypothetical protein [Tenacibaculum maritimum]MCD9627249.1 hypothetical protein [Tenacibaculum maritimum]MCD9631429.1 hypothetical protein [Tenacibaculum maritimum]MCD9634316.1 hypothetical protein [Tenacibaculum maritimum]
MVKLANIKHLKEVVFYGVLIMSLLFACQSKEKDKSLKIYHLKPNLVHVNKDTVGVYGWYSKTRSDFFAIKNFDKENEKHKTKVDSFVVNYIQKDSFLYKNKNTRWFLTFFKYGDGIDENTKHAYNTDYTIHTLFAFEKQQIAYSFNSRYKKGYKKVNYYFKDGDSIVHEDRKIISNYFKEHPIKESW